MSYAAETLYYATENCVGGGLHLNGDGRIFTADNGCCGIALLVAVEDAVTPVAPFQH